MTCLKVLVCCSLLSLFASDKCCAEWSLLSLEGKSVISIKVDPIRDTIIYAGTNGAGLFVSRDKGETWNNLLENSSVYAIAINRNNPDMILIETEDGLSISRNGGSRFQSLAVIISDPGSNRKITLSDNYNGKIYPYNGVGCVAIDETATQAIVVGIDGGLFKTFDFGKTWEPAGLHEHEITAISIDNSATLFLTS